MIIIGAAVIAVGLASVVLGLLLGARKFIRDELSGTHLQAEWDETLPKLLKLLVDAPRDKAFFAGGVGLVVIGAMLISRG